MASFCKIGFNSLSLIGVGLLGIFFIDTNVHNVGNKMQKEKSVFTLHQQKTFMVFKSNFIFDDGAAEGAGGTAEIVDNNQQQEPIVEQVQAPTLPEDIAKELEELRAWKQANYKEPEKAAEVIAKEQEQDKAEFIKYGVENDLFKIDELTQYESIKVKADADLVFESFLKEFKEENSEIVDEEALSEAAKAEFDATYKISSTNEKAKERGLAKLAKEAKEIRSPFESKVTTAQNSYTEEKNIRAKMPSFEKFIDSQIDKNVPEKVSFKIKKGEEELPIEVTLTKEDKEAIAKTFKTPKTFLQYNKSPEETATTLDRKIQGWIKEHKFEEALSKAAETGEGLGIQKGSNAGADAPFALRQGAVRPAAKVLSLEESNNKIAKMREQYN